MNTAGTNEKRVLPLEPSARAKTRCPNLCLGTKFERGLIQQEESDGRFAHEN